MRRSWVTMMAGMLGVAALASSGVAAQDPTGRVEAGPFVGGYVFDHDLGYQNSVILGGRAGYWLTRDLVGELSVGFVPSEFKENDHNASLVQTHLDALYHFNYFGGKFVPFVAAGVGGGMYDVDRGGDEAADWDWLVNYGVGAKYWLTDTMAARLDLRQPVTFDGTNHNFMYTLGVSWLFGGAPPAVAPAPPPPPPPAPVPARVVAPAPTATLTASPATIQEGQSSTLSWTTTDASDVSIDGLGAVGSSGSKSVTPGRTTTYRLAARGEGGSRDATAQVTVVPAPPADADKDGVTDDKDKCPGTPAGVKVDAQGCPLDADKDGVYDYQDKCPGTPAGVKVDAQGCPLDADKDGVTDDKDKCPGTPAGVAVDALGCPLDADKDGVTDDKDKCPGTPAGVAVDAQGCPLDADKDGVYDYQDKCPGTPAGVTVDAQGCPLDADKDGVYDYLDKCPGTPAGVAVDAQGCPLDADKDGVYDYLDKCPNTPAGMKVDRDGCSIEKLRVNLQIEFDTAKADIKPEFHDELAKVGEFMKTYPQTNVLVEGHTDNVGSVEYNTKLSQRRADAVKKYLEEKFGIAASRITSKGFGPSKPIADNGTAEGRAKNRRTEAVVDEVILRK